MLIRAGFVQNAGRERIAFIGKSPEHVRRQTLHGFIRIGKRRPADLMIGIPVKYGPCFIRRATAHLSGETVLDFRLEKGNIGNILRAIGFLLGYEQIDLIGHSDITQSHGGSAPNFLEIRNRHVVRKTKDVDRTVQSVDPDHSVPAYDIGNPVP